jgi:hypothetical protein
MKQLYLLTRDLHLYAGLFISPFLLIFALSVFCLAHGWLPSPGHPAPRTFSGLQVPRGIEQLKGKEQLALLRPLLDQMNVHGEINFVRNVASEHKLVVPVIVPGRETEVSLHLPSGTAVINERANSLWNSVVFLHKMPGPHNVAIRGNWVYTRVWRWFADATAYATLFITASGIYLWVALKAERRVGVALLTAGMLTFVGMVLTLVL